MSEPRNGPGAPSSAPGSPEAPYSMVFVARGNQTAAFNCHFPKMVAAASRNSTCDADKVRLVGLSRPCNDRLSSALGIARASSVAVECGAPGAEALWEFVQKTVPPVEVSWFGPRQDAAFHPTRIGSVETTVGAKRAKTTAQVAHDCRSKKSKE